MQWSRRQIPRVKGPKDGDHFVTKHVSKVEDARGTVHSYVPCTPGACANSARGIGPCRTSTLIILAAVCDLLPGCRCRSESWCAKGYALSVAQ